MTQKQALGRGLSALLPNRQPTPVADLPSPATPNRVPIQSIRPNPMQPRSIFQPERLQELAKGALSARKAATARTAGSSTTKGRRT